MERGKLEITGRDDKGITSASPLPPSHPPRPERLPSAPPGGCSPRTERRLRGAPGPGEAGSRSARAGWGMPSLENQDCASQGEPCLWIRADPTIHATLSTRCPPPLAAVDAGRKNSGALAAAGAGARAPAPRRAPHRRAGHRHAHARPGARQCW